MWRFLYVFVAVSSTKALESLDSNENLYKDGIFVLINNSDVGTFKRNRFNEQISKNIVEMSIVNVRVTEFTSDSLEEFERLETLNLDNVGPVKFPRGFFAGLGSLKTLRLNRNGMKAFQEEEPFRGLHNLSTVDLSFNEFEQLADVDLWFRLVRLPDTTGHNSRAYLVAYVKSAASVAAVEHLILRHNKLRSIPEAYLATTIEIPDNDLSSLDLHKFLHLKRLNASNNNIAELAVNVCGNLTSLVDLELGHNRLRSVEGNFRTCKSLERLGLSYNRIGEVDDDAFDCFAEEKIVIHFMGREPEPFQIGVDLSFNELVEFNVRAFAKTVQFVDLSSNRISELNEPIDRPVQLLKLNLSNNSIRAIEAGFFGHFSDLHVLNMSGNHLPSLRNGCLRGLASLRTLDLTSNKIAYIEDATFHDVPLLEHLYLGSNLLEHFPVQSAIVTHLISVNLNGNSFSCAVLLEILRVLKPTQATVEYGKDRDPNTLHGIRCYGDLEETPLDVDTAAALRVLHSYVPLTQSQTSTVVVFLTLFLQLLSIALLGYTVKVQTCGRRRTR